MKIGKSTHIWNSYKFPIILLASIITGSIAGIILKEKAVVFKPLGDIFLNAMFTIVVPLVFITISSAIANITSMKRLGHIIGLMLLVFIVTGLIASVIMIITVNIYPPAKNIIINMESAANLKPLQTAEQIVAAITVKDFPDLLSRKNMLPLIIFSILFGICVSILGKKAKSIANGLNILSEIMMKLINIIMYYAPIGLAAYFANLIGIHGPQLLSSYARAMLVYYPVSILYFIIAFSLYSTFAAGKKGMIIYWKSIITPAITSLATQSSIATLPVNLDAAQKIGIPKDISEIVLPIGATAHMDGSCLAAILKISFLFGIFNMPFTGLETYISAIIISVLSGVVMSGIPGGGLIGEMLIVSIYGFPPEAFPIIATIGFLVDPPATMINSTGDTVASMIVARFIEKKNWMNR